MTFVTQICVVNSGPGLNGDTIGAPLEKNQFDPWVLEKIYVFLFYDNIALQRLQILQNLF